MAHCVYLTDREMEMIRGNGVYIAHCPQSNINISSGIAPVRRMLDRGLCVGSGHGYRGRFLDLCIPRHVRRYTGFQAVRGVGRQYASAIDTAGGVLYGHQGRRQFLGQGGQL